MDSEKEKNRLSDIVLERVGLTGNLLSAPVSPSPEPAVDMPGHERHGRVTNFYGDDHFIEGHHIIATNGYLHPLFLKLLAEVPPLDM